jgi:outer membrane protein assembly factor BamB
MPITQTDKPALRKPLRLWPGVVAAVLLLLVRFGVPIVVPGFEGYRVAIFGEFLGVLAIFVWWMFFSRAPWLERLGAIILMVVAVAATWRFNHESLGIMWCVAYAVPVLNLALVAWAVVGRRLADRPRRAALVATILLASGVWALVRMDGMTGTHAAQFAWRWSETPEERLLARAGDEPAVSAPASAGAVIPPAPAAIPSTPPVIPSAAAAAETGTNWPGFRGPDRDATLPGVWIETDWSQSPPVELWRRPVGPGWSSFVVRGDLLYSQEQRGDNEVVACYNTTTGEPVWRHRDAVRFFEAMGGPGPRATPTLSDGRLYTFGATGILNALHAGDGTVLWSRNVAADTEMRVPTWGFSSSPLVVDDTVIVAAAGRLVGYDLATGDPRWLGPDGGPSYSSPHRMTIDGVAQILLLNNAGVTSVAPADGTLLWEHPWPGAPIVQPALTADGDVLISAGEGEGLRRIDVTHGPGGWTVEERWTSNRLKPNFNDFVVHGGHAFGFDGRMLACIDLEDGKRKWKGGRYGHGQLILLADQDLLLVLSEKGELALVAATPEQFTELARSPAIEGKTWNHPALVGDLLLVRNGEEMAAFRLPLARR